MICEQGDIVRLRLGSSVHGESSETFYVVVVSPWTVNRICPLTTVVPVMPADAGYPLHIKIADGNEVGGFVQCEALRAMDLEEYEQRGAAEIVGALDDTTLSKVMGCILVVLGVEGL